MNKISLSLAGAALALGACAPLETYYRPGVSVAVMERDTTACKVSALQDVPPSTQVRRAPPRYVPPRRQCNAAGDCRTRGGYYLPGEVYTFDPNDRLRKRVEAQCMADKGYAPVSIPPCPDAVKRAAPVAATRTLPVLTASSCVIRNRGGTYQIVTRG
jgi:hypothetical protein